MYNKVHLPSRLLLTEWTELYGKGSGRTLAGFSQRMF
jgi:hypothetical protein